MLPTTEFPSKPASCDAGDTTVGSLRSGLPGFNRNVPISARLDTVQCARGDATVRRGVRVREIR